MQCTGASTAEKSGADAAAQDGQVDPQRMAIAAGQACELMKTLGHKDRLMVLCHLSSGEKSVGELAALLEISQSPLSQHLARMRKESLVKTRRESQVIHYSLCDGPADRVIGVLHDIFCGTGDPAAQKDPH